MAFFSVPLSGLNAAQQSLQTVANNLANVDTDGYKAQTLTFNDVFQNTGVANGAGDPLETGSGVQVQSSYSDTADGAAQETDVASNMALSGAGYFVVQSTNGSVAYSRAGDFTTNNQGDLVTDAGATVLGYPAVNGVVNTAAPLQSLNVAVGSVLPATATTTFQTQTNLDASTAVGGATTANIAAYDSLGDTQNLTITYTKTGSNTWSYEVTAPTADGTSALGADPNNASEQVLSSGTLNFDSDGNLVSTTNSSGVTTAASTPITLSAYTPTDGAATMNMTWDLESSTGSGLITQSGLANASTNNVVSGTASATLNSYAIGSDGTIEGTYSNGQTIAMGQVAVATVENVQGLSQIGDNLYEVTAASGPASVGTAGTGGRGVIKGGYVEESNVDVATEFSQMIVSQQAYQANAKSVTTFDTIVQTTINMLQNE